ncbi:MAG: hypothetical protein JW751_23060 [Polyangiaceae bacterium]|nr:hypothetical protein [Polyangiaceae bacterium]
MRIATVHRLVLLFFVTLTVTAVVWSVEDRPPREPAPDGGGARAAIPTGAAVVVWVDVEGWRRSGLAAALFGAVGGEGPLDEVAEVCARDPTAGVRELAFAIPRHAAGTREEGPEFGLAASGDLAAEAVADCATAILRRRGADPSHQRVGGFVTVRDRRRSSKGEVAARDGGPALLSGGNYLRDMIETAEGRFPSVIDEPAHRELNEAVGEKAALVATVLLPTSPDRWPDAIPGVSASDLDHVRGIALGVRLLPPVIARALVICDEEPPCRGLAATIRNRLDAANGPLTRRWVGFNLPTRVRIQATARHVTAELSLSPEEAKRLVELGKDLWSPAGSDGPRQEP